MTITAIDGVPCNTVQEKARPVPNTNTTQKLRTLHAANEDFEWYPTTPEIMEAMKKDLWKYLREHERDYNTRREEKIYINTFYDQAFNKGKKTERLEIGSFLDIGAGDGRVLNFFEADKKYGIEIARAQADDLIQKGVFLIGRNYYDVYLNDQYYSLIFSNPPFSQFERWVNKILVDCNFCILYLVMPVRWQNQNEITRELKRYEATVVGEFDFSKADREARGKVHLVRVNAPWKKDVDSKHGHYVYQKTLENAFERWIREYIADFADEPKYDHWEEERKQELALKMTPIDQLISDFERDRKNLGAAFQAIGRLESEIIKLMGQDKKSMLEIIRKAIEGLKSKYWRAAFNKLDPVQKRMTYKTRERIFRDIDEFKTLDFNADNIYSIVIWIINNCNIGILEQIGEVFDALTSPEFIEEYKSNRHWKKSDWRHTERDWKYEKLPPRWKLGLDYRIVVGTYYYDRYSGSRTIVDDFIIICRNLGFPIDPEYTPDYKLHQAEQKFFTEDGELAFTMRYYTGNHNAHLKINKRLLMKFNIEVAKIRRWMSDPADVAEEYGIPKDEAARLWNSGLSLLGTGDVKMLEFKEAV
jgi:SAM-dependent methyltransferase